MTQKVRKRVHSPPALHINCTTIPPEFFPIAPLLYRECTKPAHCSALTIRRTRLIVRPVLHRAGKAQSRHCLAPPIGPAVTILACLSFPIARTRAAARGESSNMRKVSLSARQSALVRPLRGPDTLTDICHLCHCRRRPGGVPFRNFRAQTCPVAGQLQPATTRTCEK